jgi:hypothetical protein
VVARFADPPMARLRWQQNLCHDADECANEQAQSDLINGRSQLKDAT